MKCGILGSVWRRLVAAAGVVVLSAGIVLSLGVVLSVGLAQPALAQAGPGGQAPTFLLRDVRFSPSRYLSAEELAALAAPYEGRQVTFDDLLALTRGIDQYYLQRGILTATAVLPPQDVVGGVLRVDLVEASLSEVALEGFKYTREDYLRARIDAAAGTQPDFDVLGESLLLFAAANDFPARVQFSPGAEAGTARLLITGDEPPQYGVTASLNNYGRAETGRLQGIATARVASLTGRRDPLSGQYTRSEGLESGAIQYSVPVDLKGGRVFMSGEYSESRVVNGLFSTLDLETTGAAGTLGYSRPFAITPLSRFEWAVATSADWQKTDLSGVQLSELAVADGSLQWSWLGQGPGVSYAGLGKVVVGGADTDTNSDVEGAFMTLNGQLDVSKALGDAFLLTAGFVAQYGVTDNLPSVRQISVGGIGTVRGYPEAVISGDSGAVARFQLEPAQPVLSFGEGRWRFTATPFVFQDTGVAVPFRADEEFDSDRDLLASAGFGGRIGIGPVQIVALAAVPLLDTVGFEAGEPEYFIGADLRHSFGN